MCKLRLLELMLLYDELEVVKIKAYYRGELFQTSSANICFDLLKKKVSMFKVEDNMLVVWLEEYE